MPLLRKKDRSDRILYLPTDAIRPNPDQPRRFFDPEGLEELANSIRALGILQPLTVRQAGEDGWELVAGERRLRAAALAGLDRVPCISIQTDSQSSSLLALVENLQRRDLDFLEEALALDKLLRTYCLSQDEVARRIGKSQSAVANKLRLLRLPPKVLARLRAAALAGLDRVPCISIQTDSQSSSLLALVENLQRRDLDFLEEALALDKLLRTYCLSQDEVARRIGKSQSAVANKLRLLRLPPKVLARLREGGLTERHARALLRLENDHRLEQAAEHIIAHRLTVAQTDQYVEGLLAPKNRKPKRTYIIKDVRLFLNSVSRGLSIMRSAGVDACCQRQDLEDAICLTIRIPK